jgi:hypothetical protein
MDRLVTHQKLENNRKALRCVLARGSVTCDARVCQGFEVRHHYMLKLHTSSFPLLHTNVPFLYS